MRKRGQRLRGIRCALAAFLAAQVPGALLWEPSSNTWREDSSPRASRGLRQRLSVDGRGGAGGETGRGSCPWLAGGAALSDAGQGAEHPY